MEILGERGGLTGIGRIGIARKDSGLCKLRYFRESIAQRHRENVILNPQKGISHSILIHRNASLTVARERIVHPNGKRIALIVVTHALGRGRA